MHISDTYSHKHFIKLVEEKLKDISYKLTELDWIIIQDMIIQQNMTVKGQFLT